MCDGGMAVAADPGLQYRWMVIYSLQEHYCFQSFQLGPDAEHIIEILKGFVPLSFLFHY